MKTVLALLLISVTFRAEARLGENEAQIVLRYNTPLKQIEMYGLPAKAYKFAGMIVAVVYLDGKSACEIYTKDPSGAFSDNEATLILNANSAGMQWDLSKDFKFGSKNWVMPDGSKFATWNTLDPMISVYTKELALKIQADQKEKEAKNLNGL